VQGTVCKILSEQEVKPHKVRYYLERRDPEFKAKMAANSRHRPFIFTAKKQGWNVIKAIALGPQILISSFLTA